MNNEIYKITVIVPSYNNGQYISQCLDSIINQKTNFKYQIIITDDASQDNSQEIIRKYEKKYPEKIVALYSSQNCKLFTNVLKALEIMRTEYYCVLDPDDYWIDMYRLQKAVDFLDENPEYTIYATNLEREYNNGIKELRYDLGNLKEKTSTYEDYVNGKAVISCTPASTYRNVCFNNGIPKEFYLLKGTIYEDVFRADTARNLMHLNKGKIYFVNEVVATCRYHGKGLCSSTSIAEQYIQLAFAHVAYFEFFGKKYFEQYYNLVLKFYTLYVKECYKNAIKGSVVMLRDKFNEYSRIVSKWLVDNKSEKEKQRVPFSLGKFAEIADDSKKVVVWGTGSGAQNMLQKYNIKLSNIAYFVDNNSSKQGTQFLEKDIKAPDSLKSEQNVVLIIASSYYKQIIQQINDEVLCDTLDILNLFDYDENWC